jgi:hypothetical protein
MGLLRRRAEGDRPALLQVAGVVTTLVVLAITLLAPALIDRGGS